MVKSLYEWDTMDDAEREEWLQQSSLFLQEGLAQSATQLLAVRWYLNVVQACLYKGIAFPVVALHAVIRECGPSVTVILNQLEPEQQQFWVVAFAMSTAYSEGFERGMNLSEEIPAHVDDRKLPDYNPN